MSAAIPDDSHREVIVGRNSKTWQLLVREPRIAARFAHAVSHAELDAFAFTPRDRVWVFAYSRNPTENRRMLEVLSAAGVASVVYVSSASTIVNRLTRCYEYPRVKQLAEEEARKLAGARVLVLGLVHQDPAELPAGLNAATRMDALVEFMLDPEWPDDGGTTRRLFAPVHRDAGGGLEAGLQRLYSALMRLAHGWPCALRPVDYLLRACGFRWYGYIHLSNRLWYSTKS